MIRLQSQHMASLKELQKRYNDAYLENWLPQHREMKVLQDLMVEYLTESEKQIERMMEYHQEIFFQQFPLVQRYGISEEAQLFISPSSVADTITIEEQEGFSLQEEPLSTYVSKSACTFDQQIFDTVYVLDHAHHTLTSHQAPLQNISLQQVDDPIVTTWKIAFSVVLSTQEQTCELQIACEEAKQTALYQFLTTCECSLYSEEAYLGECQLIMEKEYLNITLPEREEILSSIYFIFTYEHAIPACNITAITLHFNDQTVNPTQILVQETECAVDEFALFDIPLELYQEAYIRCDEAFSKAKAEITLSGHMKLQQEVVGKEFLVEAVYRPIMRSLPKEQIVYDAYVDQVQLQYFHGEWSKLPKVQWEATQWKCDGSFTITFRCPSDIEPLDLDGETGFWLRFVLVKSENCYLLPCHHHIPHIQKLQIQVKQASQGCPATGIWITDLDGDHDGMEELKQHGMIVISDKDKTEGIQLYFHLEQPLQQTHHLYIEMQTNYHLPQDMEYAYDSYTGKGTLSIIDETEGLSHSGGLHITCPKDMRQTNHFGMEGYWIILQLHDILQYNKIKSIKEHYIAARLQDQEIKEYEVPTRFPITIEEQYVEEVWIQEDTVFIKWEMYPCLDQQLRHVFYEEDSGQLTIPVTACQAFIRKRDSISIRLVTHIPSDERTLEKDATLMPCQPHQDISQVTLIQPLSLFQSKQKKQDRQKKSAMQVYNTDVPYSLQGIQRLIEYEFVDVTEVRCVKEERIIIYIACQRAEIRPKLFEQIYQLLAKQLPNSWVSRLVLKEQMDIQIDVGIITTASQHDTVQCCKEYLQQYINVMGTYPNEQDMRQRLSEQLMDSLLELHIQGEALVDHHVWQTTLDAFRDFPHGVLSLRRIDVFKR